MTLIKMSLYMQKQLPRPITNEQLIILRLLLICRLHLVNHLPRRLVHLNAAYCSAEKGGLKLYSQHIHWLLSSVHTK